MLGIQDVLIESGKISQIAPKLKSPKNAHVIDAKGSTLLPGLIDSHQHIDDGRYTLVTDALFGISTVIDLFTGGRGNTPREIHERVRNTEPGESADFQSAGICITVKGGHGTEYGLTIPTLDDPKDALAFIDARIAEGSDVIKIIYEDFGGRMPRLPKETMAAAIQAAHARGRLLSFTRARTRCNSRLDRRRCGRHSASFRQRSGRSELRANVFFTRRVHHSYAYRTGEPLRSSRQCCTWTRLAHRAVAARGRGCEIEDLRQEIQSVITTVLAHFLPCPFL